MPEALRRRLMAFALAVFVVGGVLAGAFYTRFVWRGPTPSADAASVVSIWRETPVSSAPAPAPMMDRRAPSTPMETDTASAPVAPQPSSLAGIAQAARGQGFSGVQGARDLPPARVEGQQTREGALQRTIARAAQARVTEYARGEAQRYADPREDSLYEEGSDPATAAHRPCPPGTTPRGDGQNLRGRTCQPVR